MLVPRPALVIARRDTGMVGALLWTLMITSLQREAWTGDVPIERWEQLGLIISSRVRTAKVTTIEEESATLIGRLDEPTWQEVVALVRPTIGA